MTFSQVIWFIPLVGLLYKYMQQQWCCIYRETPVKKLQAIINALNTAIQEGDGVLSPSTMKALTAFRDIAAKKLAKYEAL